MRFNKHISIVIPALNEQGVAVMQLPHLDESYVQLTTVLIHSSGQMLSSTVALADWTQQRSIGRWLYQLPSVPP